MVTSYDNNITFPKERVGREEYVTAVTAEASNLQNMPLCDMVQLRQKIEREVGKRRLAKAKAATESNPLHYYLWTKDSPVLDTTFRVLTLGLIHLLFDQGKAAYQKKAPTFDLVLLIRKIDGAEKDREAEIREIKINLLKATRTGTFVPETLTTLLTALKRLNGTVDSSTHYIIKNYVDRNASHFLNAPSTYTNEPFYAHLMQVYSLLSITDEDWRALTEAKEVYTLATIWKELPFEDKLALLEKMQPTPRRFAPILQQILSETKECFAWDRFCTYSNEEQHQVLTLADIILSIGDLEGRNLLSDTLTNLREYIRSVQFKNYAWDDAQAVEFLKNICDNLNLPDEFRIAFDTYEIETLWEQISNERRVENTELLVADHKHYENELERRRKDLFASLESKEIKTTDRPLPEFEYIIKMLRLLTPVFTQGCEHALKTIETELLEALKDSAKNQEQRNGLSIKGRLLGINADLVADLSNDGWAYSIGMYIWSWGKRREERIEEALTKDLTQNRYQMRELGIPTPIDHVPKASEREQYKTTKSHLKVGPPAIPRVEGRSNITELLTFLDQADREGLIPNTLRESTTDTSFVSHNKRTVIDSLSQLLNQLQNGSQLNDRLTQVRNILNVYAVQVKERLRQASSKRDIYTELVDLVCKELGFACFHCQDRMVNAAMVIYNEKIVGNIEETGTIQNKVLVWLAKKRGALVSTMLQEMIQGAFAVIFSDVSSSISRWRYVMRRQLGLGEVPSPAHSIASGLSEEQILAKFEKTYTVDWILDQAMEEYNKPQGNSALKSIAIAEFLGTRISNFAAIQDDLLDEETYLHLTKEGMALYLQEIGVFTPIV